MFKTLFSRMLVTYLALVLGILVFLGVTVSSVFRAQYVTERESELEREAAEIVDVVIHSYIKNESRETAKNQIRNSARKYDALIQLVFIDPSLGKVEFFEEQSREKWEGCSLVDISEYAEEAMIHGSVFVCRNIFKPHIQYSTISVVSTICDEWGNTLGAVLIHDDVTDMNAAINDIYFDVGIISLIAILLAMLAVSYITVIVTRPMSEMTAVVRRYTKGDFDARVDVKGVDEVSRLGENFNRMANELSRLEKTRKSFVANVSHELRSPLSSMRGFVEAMLDGTIEKEDYEKYLTIVLNENKRMAEMVNDLLDLARIESGQSELKRTVFDINELVINTLLTFEPQIDRKRIEVRLELYDGALFVDADEARITQVLHNLIHNAIKFSDEGGKLVATTRAGDKAYVTVANGGAGISEEDLPFIFDRFYKAEKAHTPTNGSGTGLGLAIVKRIIDQHEEKISVESCLGGETSFTFTLKLVHRQKRHQNAKKM